jgi:enterochelin esterase-like enzyme
MMHRVSTAVLAFTLTVVGCLSWLMLPGAPALADGANGNRDPLQTQLEQLRSTAPRGETVSVLDSIAFQLETAERINKHYPAQAQAFRTRAADWLKQASAGQDPLQAARGQIVMRGYSSPISQVRQGYAIYLPKDYDPKRAYPLMLVLHGGSANGNLFLGVVLGNNMNWKEYDQHLWDDFTPRYTPDWIVVAPDGFGQVMWRFMGEQDMFDVLADVQKHYNVDADRVVLFGLSNGGVGAYSMGMRHASRFSAVLAVAGAPSWLKYAGGSIDPLQAEALHPLSAMSLAENAINTDFRFFHGHTDPGPMRPAFVEAFGKHIATLGVPYKEKWFDTGHDLLYLVVRQGALFKDLAGVKRNRHPKEVRLVTGDYGAAEQHWLRVTRIERVPQLARVRAVAEGDEIQLETQQALALELAWKDAPLATGTQLRVRVDGKLVLDTARSGLGERLQLLHDGSGWRVAVPAANAGLEKQPGSAGPITDAYARGLVHVYGTGDPALTAQLKKSAEQGAKGWTLWLWRLEQRVLADTQVTDAVLRDSDLVLYGTPGSNSLLSKIEKQLPIQIEKDAIVVGEQRFAGKGVGTKFIYPSPWNPQRYVLIQAAPTAEGVQGGNNLPDFLPDYVVYDAKTTRSRPRLLFGAAPLALGYFDASWHIDPAHTQRSLAATARRGSAPLAQNEGNGPESADDDNPKSPLPVPTAPATPALPLHYATEPRTQAGKAARDIARRVSTFTNYRSQIAGATWVVDESITWSIRERETCMAELEQQGIQVEAWSGALPTPVATPLKLRAAVSGVTFRFMHGAAGAVISCELAARLRDLASVLAKHGVHTVYVMSAYRDHPYPSFHTLGLALDLSRFDTAEGPLVVKSDFVIDRAHETCDQATAGQNDKDRVLHAIACELAKSRRFSSVLTPNYNVGHRDHFHLDVRPDDPRLFLR